MRTILFFAYLSLFISSDILAQNLTVGTTFYDSATSDGYILTSPMGRSDSYLIDNCGRVINSWNTNGFPALYAYLHTDAKLYRAMRINNPDIPTAGLGGRFERYNWSGLLDWHFEYSDSNYTPHHDFVILPNGNILFIFIEVKTATEAYNAGRDPNLLTNNKLWTEALMEIEPLGVDSARIVWEWHAWDHLVQEVNPIAANYDTVALHPELIDLNYTLGNNAQDWLHANSVSYNANLDQLAVSIRNTNEIWVIDHSTTTAEAAGHSGGNSGRGGDLLYRWGNAEAYQVNTPAIFEAQHDVTWVGDTSLMVYNNAPLRSYASIELMELPPLVNGAYNLPPSGQAFTPALPNWTYNLSSDISSGRLSSAQRLLNGHTLICSGNHGYIFELDAQDSVVWEYKNPATSSGIASQGDLIVNANQLFKARRYAASDPRFDGKDMSPGNPIELNFDLSLCPNTNIRKIQQHPLSLFPNPSQNYFIIEGEQSLGQIEIFHSNGQLFKCINSTSSSISIESQDWPLGFYIIKTQNHPALKLLKTP